MNRPDPQPPQRVVRLRDVGLALVAGLLFFVASVRFGGSVAGDELDPAWTMVLRWASMHGLRWGSDIVFTYGPLGYLSPFNAADPAHYGLFVAAQIALAAAAAFLFAHAWIAQRWPERVFLLTAVGIAAPLLAADPVWLATPVFALAGMHAHAAAGRGRALWLLLVVAALYLATILLIKMSGLLLILACWLAGSVMLLCTRRRGHAAAWLLLVPLCAFTLWLLSGQRAGDLLPFMGSVLEMSRGYTAAMGYFPPLRFDLYGAAVFGGCGAVGLWAAWRARRAPGRLACIALAGFALFIAWRAGFTRADTHITIFALTTWLTLPLLPALTPAATPWLRAASLGVALAAVPLADRAFNPGPTHRHGDLARAAPQVLKTNAGLLLRPLTYHPLLIAAVERERRRLDLPQIRAAVGNHSVDLLGTQQGVVIINGFGYRPAPVFQGYGAYTPWLQQRNAAAYSGPQRTDYVLLAYSPIDGNLASSENALAFTTLYRNYHPVLVEKSYLLLEKDAESAPAQAPLQDGWQAMRWNEWTVLPTAAESVTVVALRSELSFVGKLMATLLREPAQFIEVELADGRLQRFRLGRGNAASGFLLSPLLQSQDDYVRLFAGMDLPEVRRFRLLPQSETMQLLFADTIRWSVTQLPRRPQTELPPALLDAFYPGFSHRPQIAAADTRSMEVQGQRVLFLHSPAQLSFRPGPGSYVISGELGIVPGAFASASCSGGDGVEIKVSGGAAGALTYAYNPFADAALRPARRFELGPLQASADGELRLDVMPGPANNADCDWAHVRDIRIRAAGDGDPGRTAAPASGGNPREPQR